MLTDSKVYTLSHIAGGFLLPPVMKASVSEIVGVLRYELSLIDGFEMSDDVTDAVRRNIAHSFKKEERPFTMVAKDKSDRKHVFRVDKHNIQIGVQ